MPPIGGADEAGAVVAVLRVHIDVRVERQLEQRHVISDFAGSDEICALLRLVLHIDVRPGVDEQSSDVDVVSVCRCDKRGGAGRVTSLDAGTAVEV